MKFLSDVNISGGARVSSLAGTGVRMVVANAVGEISTQPLPVATTRQVLAGNGMTGGGVLAADVQLTLGTPGAVTLSSTNSVSSTSHTHKFEPGGTTSQYIRGDGSLATFPNTFVGQYDSYATLLIELPEGVNSTSWNAANEAGFYSDVFNEFNELERYIWNVDSKKWVLSSIRNQLCYTILQSDIATYSQNHLFIPNALYEISGCDEDLYGGTTIWLKAISDSELEEEGVGEFFNIDYTAAPLVKDYNWWHDIVAPEIYINPRLENAIYFEDDVVIWGGKAWICHTDIPNDNTDYILNDFELNTSYFTETTNGISYKQVFDKIKYNISLNKITYREDEYGNIVEYTSNYFTILNVVSQDAYINDINPIRAFKWGTTKVQGNRVYNSLLLNINFDGDSMVAMELKDYGLLCYTNIQGSSTTIGNCVISNGFALQYNTFINVVLTSFYLQGAIIQSISSFAISMMTGMNFKSGFFADWDNVGFLVGVWGGYRYSNKNIVRMDFSRALTFKIPDLPNLAPNGIILDFGSSIASFLKKEIISYIDKDNDKYGKLQCVNGLTGITFVADLTD